MSALSFAWMAELVVVGYILRMASRYIGWHIIQDTSSINGIRSTESNDVGIDPMATELATQGA